MGRDRVLGRGGFLLIILLAALMYAGAYSAGHPFALTGNPGICLPSPNSWDILPAWGEILNGALGACVLFTLYLANRRFNFIAGTGEAVMIAMCLVAMGANPWVSGRLTSSPLLALANAVCLYILYGCFRRRNCSRAMFAIASILSLGAMVQYGFFFMIPAYLAGAVLLKCLDAKGLIAFILGLAAPWWVGLGLGILQLDNFRSPSFTNLFDGFTTKEGLLVGVISVAFTIAVALFSGLANSVKLYAGNTERRLFNSAAVFLGLVCAVCIVFDWNNMIAYLDTLYLVLGVELGNLFGLRRRRGGKFWFWTLVVIYCASFSGMAFGIWN